MNPDALLYTDQAARWCDTTPDVIRQWARRYPAAMPVRDRDWRGRPRYRLADILEVERATRTRAWISR